LTCPSAKTRKSLAGGKRGGGGGSSECQGWKARRTCRAVCTNLCRHRQRGCATCHSLDSAPKAARRTTSHPRAGPASNQIKSLSRIIGSHRRRMWAGGGGAARRPVPRAASLSPRATKFQVSGNSRGITCTMRPTRHELASGVCCAASPSACWGAAVAAAPCSILHPPNSEGRDSAV
jgi:hypothetical protein